MPKLAHTPAYLRRLITCDPVAGTMAWRRRPLAMFSHCRYPRRACASWNTKFAGTPALATPHGSGYLAGKLGGRGYRAHRVIYALHHGKWPDGEIDHINGVRDDNRVSNLRDVTPSENMRNQPLPSNNTSGRLGVSWIEGKKRWRAYISMSRRQVHLGYFTNKDDAIEAREAAETKYGFHENHGRPPCQS